MPDYSKRKSRDGSEDAGSRKKQHRHTGADQEVQFEDYGGGGDAAPTKSSHKTKEKSTRNEKEYPSINELKKRIRDVKRLLNKTNLPADARIVQERALAGYEQDLVEESARRERSQMISKYHFVRFLDRKTATKQLNRLLRREKEHDLDSKQKARLAQKIHTARVNLNYTIYYPLTEKYIAVYPKSKETPTGEKDVEAESESDSQDHKKQTNDSKPALWPIVEKCMEDGTLDLLREGKLNIGADGKQISAPSNTRAAEADGKKSKKQEGPKESKDASRKEKRVSRDTQSSSKRDKPNRRDQRREHEMHNVPVNHEPDGNESDGGFFEG